MGLVCRHCQSQFIRVNLMFCGVDRVENPVRLLSVGTIHGEMASMFKLGF